MSDEDLAALQSILTEIDPDARIDIGRFRCAAIELYRLTVEVQRYRAHRVAMRQFVSTP